METLRRKLNARNGAVIGTTAGLVAVTLGYFIDTEFHEIINNSSVYKVGIEAGLAILVAATIPLSVTGYINERVFNPLQDRLRDYLGQINQES